MKITRKQLKRLIKEMTDPEIDPRYEMIKLYPGIYLHGTSTYFGLKPGDILLPPKDTGRQTEKRARRRGKVFFTDNLASARHYANRAAITWSGKGRESKPIIFLIKPTGKMKKISGMRSNNPQGYLYGPAYHSDSGQIMGIYQ